ncbi:MAG TPA: GNAT family N-acetyltransferase [Streptosporangiaceae bacterium]|nr:GNAT family N-acetyltransferase [Streptosporangiaceae bacterium]
MSTRVPSIAVPPAASAADGAAAIRPARPADRQPLLDMLARCSTQSRLQRFHGFLRSYPEPYFTGALAGTAEHVALVAEVAGTVVALASCITVAPSAADIAVLVEDASQRQGIGTGLLAALVGHARSAGLATLNATLLAEQGWILRVLRRYGRVTARVSLGVYEASVFLGPPTARAPVVGAPMVGD